MCPQWLKDMKQASFINMKKKKKLVMPSACKEHLNSCKSPEKWCHGHITVNDMLKRDENYESVPSEMATVLTSK